MFVSGCKAVLVIVALWCAGFCEPLANSAPVNLEWRPAHQTVVVGDEVQIGLYAVSDNDVNQSIASMSAVVLWDEEFLGTVGHINNGPYLWYAAGFFMNDLGGLNDDRSDGDIIFTGFGQFAPADPACVPVPPDGLLITTFTFDAVAKTEAAVVGIPLRHAQVSQTEVYDGFLPGFDVTGTLGTATVRILPAIDLVMSQPPPNSIDARQPSDVDGGNATGWQSIDLLFDGVAACLIADDFSISVEPTIEAPPVVTGVTATRNRVTLQLDKPIPPGRWTNIAYQPTGTTVRVGALPADVNGDGTSGPLDLLALIDALNGVTILRPMWQVDLDRSGEVNSLDILREVDLLNGAGEFEAWNGRTLPP